MLTTCQTCSLEYDDIYRLTICPHEKFEMYTTVMKADGSTVVAHSIEELNKAMGIDNVEELKDIPEEYHVVVVGRTGEHPGSDVCLFGPGSKRLAVHTCEKNYRIKQDLKTNVSLISTVVFSGGKDAANVFIDRLIAKMNETKQVEENKGG